MREILITFPVDVEFPDGFEQVLSTLVGMICEKYQEANSDRAMWPSGHGNQPIMSMGDVVGYQDHVYTISCEEREDYYGSNKYNPKVQELRAKARAERMAEKTTTPSSNSSS